MENNNFEPAADAVENAAAVTSPVPKKRFIGKREFLMFGIAAGGQGMIYATMSSYISDFYINVMGLPLVFVLLLMLLARVWDAVNDPMMGVIVDKCTTPWGKMKPYVLFTALPIAALTFLMFFSPPGLNQTELMVYAAFVYVGWGMIYTVSDVPFWSMPNVMTPDPAERANTISFGRTVNGSGADGAFRGAFLDTVFQRRKLARSRKNQIYRHGSDRFGDRDSAFRDELFHDERARADTR